MFTRATSDYSPLRPGSREENEAIHARKEMMAVFASRTPKEEPKRKGWRDRMRLRAKGFDQKANTHDGEGKKKPAKPRKSKPAAAPKVKTKVETKGKKAAKV
jgi:hypothetical protein